MTDSARIALFIPWLPHGCGVDEVAATLAEGLADAGWDVDVLYADATAPGMAMPREPVRVVDLAARRTIGTVVPLRHYLRRAKPAALLPSGLTANLVASLARSRLTPPVALVMTEHAPLEHMLADAPMHKRAIMSRLIRALYPRADGHVAVSRGIRGAVATTADLPADRVDVVYNPIDADVLRRRASEPVSHPWFGPARPPVVLGVGRLEPQKDFALLVRAFRRLRDHLDARLMILGEGQQRRDLQELVRALGLKDEVSLPGRVADPLPFMANCGAFVLSSRYEGLPTVLLEALAAGALIVATDCPSGPDEILQGGKFGRLVPVGDAQALYRAMQEVLTSPPPRPPAVALERFSIERAVSGYSEVLDRVT